MEPPPSRWRRIEQLFDDALETPPEQRAAFLDAACAGDAELRMEVVRLLHAFEESHGFLEQPAADFAAPMLDVFPALELPSPGARIGPYRLVEEAGRGGMGVVYLAERDDGEFRKRVALKLVHSGLIVDEELHRRFREERQILASLEHSGVARLLDGGVTEDGLPWFAMEYVDGTSIDRYCDEHRLDVDARLRLFCAVCDAVQHAHERNIVHRDLKPGNILVTRSGTQDAGNCQVKLLDFGIAKLLGEGSDGAASVHTRPAMRLMTPEYASPEQLRGEPVTPAADVHALGVLLYQLLCGRHPYAGTEGGKSIEQRVLTTHPEAPSQASPEGLRHRLKGDLDAIILKALSKAPGQRYPSAGPFAADIRRHLEGTTVGALRELRVRRVRGFLRRPAIVTAFVAALPVAAVASYAALDRIPARELHADRVVVAPFENRTGQPSLDAVGSMAADWIIQGLSRTGMMQVVPVTATLTASRFVDSSPNHTDAGDRVRLLAEETGAGVVVSGSYYHQGDSLYLLATVTDVRAGRVLHAPPPIGTPLELPLRGVQELRERLTGVLAPHFNPRTQHHSVRGGVTPPSFDAYRLYAEGMERFIASDWRSAVRSFALASSHDSTFTVPLVYAGMALSNMNELAAADSVLDILRPRLHLLGELEQMGVAVLETSVRGDHMAHVEAQRRAPELAPNTIAHWSLGQALGRVHRPREAIALMVRLDPHRGELRGWLPYWVRLAEAHHHVGSHREELRVARRARELFPQAREALDLEIDALSALGRPAAVRALLNEHAGDEPYRGLLLQNAGLGLIAHGSTAEGEALLRESLGWLLARAEPTPQHRRNLANSHYLNREWTDAERLLRELASDYPRELWVQGGLGTLAARRGDAAEARQISRWLAELEGPYLRGRNTLWRARIAALSGDPAEAVNLLRRAWREGVGNIWHWVDHHPDFESIRNYPPVRELVRPRG